jgi:hypothetical protein
MESVIETSPVAVTLNVVNMPAIAPSATAPSATAPSAPVATDVPTIQDVATVKPSPIDAVVEAVTKDDKFLATVKTSVEKILKDGKVDQSDIPELVFIISETVNSLGSFNVSVDMVPVVIKMIYKFIVEKYNLVPEDKKADFERIVDSSLRLLMFQPTIRKGLNSCLAFLTCTK